MAKTLAAVLVAVLMTLALTARDTHAQNRDNSAVHLQSIAESLRALVQVEKERNQRCK